MSTYGFECLIRGPATEQAYRGAYVAAKVWDWLQQERRIQYVPWAMSDPIKAARQAEHDSLLDMLEHEIREAAKEARGAD